MPTIDYKPINLLNMVPGISPKGGGVVPPIWERLGDKDRWISTTYTPILFSCVFGNGHGAAVGASTNASSGSPDKLARFIVLGNAARRGIKVQFLAGVNNAGTTGTITVEHGGATETLSVTATSPTWSAVTITPTTGTAPLELLIKGHTDDANYLGIESVTARYVDTDIYSGGEGDDGYAPLGDGFNTHSYSASSPVADNKPISNELVSRGFNNMRAIARDRVACLATLQHAQNTSSLRPWWVAFSTALTMTSILRVPASHEGARSFRLAVYVQAVAGTTGKAVALINGSEEITMELSTGSGAWFYNTITLDTSHSNGIAFYCQRLTGTGQVGVSAAQVFRYPD